MHSEGVGYISNAGIRPSGHGLSEQGIRNISVACWNLGTAQLIEHAVQRHEGLLAKGVSAGRWC